MSIARNLERRLERLVEGISATLFRGKMHPVDLANRLVREADLAVTDGPAGPSIPNRYEIYVDPAEVATDSVGPEVVAELEHAITATASERGWRLDGPVRVSVTAVPGAPAGGDVAVATEAGPLAPWCRLGTAGMAFDVGPNRAIVGRDSTADVQLTDAAVSRVHSLLWRESGRVWITDLGSANGTAVDGRPIDGTTELTGGEVLTFGGTTLTYRPVSTGRAG